ncbi:hypothetical protein [Methanococcus maripaludis]|uniref:Uncharacterized protein n=1 Tax=Methanococcus maripaludis OS7 TaxID=637915 RepID=A0A2Z5PP23_METMI|nr:hypothetical protein [Methanococcus maripaludis]BAP62564.1 hypothetical protein MMOS7_04780 [Methanococcus maripaludis OS7]
MDENRFLKSLYIPKDCLQGAEFPGHVTWDRYSPARIKVIIPEGIVVSEMYNVKENGFVYAENSLDIYGFEDNGYVGFVFKSEKLNTKEEIKEIYFKMDIDGNELVKTKKIYLFRPEITFKQIPNSITINKSGPHTNISDHISIKNSGKGTMVLGLALRESEYIKEALPENIDEYIKNYNEILYKRLETLMNTYEPHKEVLLEYYKFKKSMTENDGTMELNKDFLDQVANLIDKFKKIFEEDEKFAYDFTEAHYSAQMMSMNILTELSGFLEFLKNTTDKKILLIGATAILDISKELENLELKVSVSDFANNDYPATELSIPLNIISNSDRVKIPLYQLFTFENGVVE